MIGLHMQALAALGDGNGTALGQNTRINDGTAHTAPRRRQGAFKINFTICAAAKGWLQGAGAVHHDQWRVFAKLRHAGSI